MVSIKDVAKEAGVAISTVSKVLNNYPNVSEATKAKVNEVVERLGFVPNAVAASLSSKRVGRVALLIRLNLDTSASDEINMQYISGAVHRAKELQMDLITVFYSMIEDMNLEEVKSYFESQGIRGIIMYGLTTKDKVLHKLIDSGDFKIVVIDAPMVNETTTSVSINHEKAQYDVAKKTITENKCKKAQPAEFLPGNCFALLRLPPGPWSLVHAVFEGYFYPQKADAVGYESAVACL